MISRTVTLERELATVQCAQCGMLFWVDAYTERQYRQDGRTFFCPQGHSLHFGPGEIDRLKQQVTALNGKLANAQFELGAATAKIEQAQGTIARMKKRAHNGMCPVCRRSFAALQRHMHAKHPHYGADHAQA